MDSKPTSIRCSMHGCWRPPDAFVKVKLDSGSKTKLPICELHLKSVVDGNYSWSVQDTARLA